MLLAQEEAPAGIYNPVVGPFGTGEGTEIVAEIIGKILNLAFMIGGLILLVMIIVSGIQWMLAGGNKEALSRAQGRLTSAIIGFVILASTYAILGLIANVLNIGFLKDLVITWPTL